MIGTEAKQLEEPPSPLSTSLPALGALPPALDLKRSASLQVHQDHC